MHFNVNELFWMLRCNRTKNDVSTFFMLNIDCFIVRNWVLPYMKQNTKRSAVLILILYIHFHLSFPDTSGAKKHKRWLERKLEGFFGVSLRKMWLIEYRIVTKYQDFYNCGRWLHHRNSRGFYVRFDLMTLTT